jgi:antitoxin (DNA-binding transcriptional repressor) of toxin-antitoxin stability system
MHTIRVEQSATLAEVVAGLTPGEPVVITRGGKPVARITAEPAVPRPARKAGSAKGQLVILAEDDDHLAHFAEYLG